MKLHISSIRRMVVNILALGLSKSYYASQVARRVVQLFDNDDNADMYRNGEFRLLKEIIARRQKGIVVDVGANRGDWSEEVLKLGFEGRLVAVDPLEKNISAIRHRLSSYGLLELVETALSDTEGEKTFFSNLDTENSGTDSLHNMRLIGYDAGVVQMEVRCTTLKELAQRLTLKRIDFLKVDVEGHEFFVLRGAAELLVQERIDFIQIEFGHAARAARIYLHDIVKMIGEHQYSVFIIKPASVVPLNFTPFVENRYAYVNLLIVRNAVVPEIANYIRKR